MPKKYQIIYADPPWSFNFQHRNGLSNDAKAALYPTMKAQDIVDLPVGAIADDGSESLRLISDLSMTA